jgi:hypothetical protein
MSRSRDLPGAAWVAIGLAAGALIVPAAAVAAGNVGIIGSNGHTAKVTASGNLQVAEATPAAFKEYVHLNFTADVCTKVATAPLHKGFVLKQATFNFFAVPSTGVGENMHLYTTKTCTTSGTIFDDNPGSVNAYQYSFDPGFALAPGHSLYAEQIGTVKAELYLLGYTVNPKAIHANTPHAIRGKATAQR